MRDGIVIRMANTASFLALALALTAPASRAGGLERTERTLTWSAPWSDGAAVRIDNLLGSLEIVGEADGREVRVEARVVVESDDRAAAEALAEGVRLDGTVGDHGIAVRVVFPTEHHAMLRPPKNADAGLVARVSGWVTPLVRKSTVAVDYDGRSVAIGNARGASALAVHVRVVLPADVPVEARQAVGSLAVSRVRGGVRLETVEGRIDADQTFGRLHARALGASVAVRSFRGEALEVESGSGAVDLADIQCARIAVRTASGAITAQAIDGGEVHLDTDSGPIALSGVEPRSFEIASGSGRVDLATNLRRTRSGEIRSDSGDVIVRLGNHAPFEIVAESTSGAVRNKLPAEAVEQSKGRAVWRRGTGGVALRFTSERGGVEVVPM